MWSKKTKYGHKLRSNIKFQQYSVFGRNDLVEKKLKAVENHQEDF